MSIKIVFYDSKPYTEDFFNRANAETKFQLKFFKNHLSRDTTVLAKDSDVVCVFVNDILDAGVIDSLYSLDVKLIALRCAGFNNVDLKAAHGKIPVVRVPEYSPYAVAEHTIALILSLNRKIHRAYSRIRDLNFTIQGLMGFDLHDKVIGVVGTGKIGKVMIKIAGGFGMKVIAYDPFPDKDYADKKGFEYVSLDNLYKDSDIISLHCPLTPDNMHMINDGAISKMKQNVMIVNTGRGKLIDTRALIGGLKTKKIGSAGLDVYEEETEYFFEDFSSDIINDDILARLLTFPNVLITSHQGFFTQEAFHNIAEVTLNNIKGFFIDRKIENEVCFKCG
jgi:D-lactate dehydrogenase